MKNTENDITSLIRFVEQKDLAGGKKTMRAWYWMVCGVEYDTQHENG